MASLVSVIIPTYGRSGCLSRCIESVLIQDYSDFEIIVIDDNPPESEERINTSIFMKQYEQETRIRYIMHEKNKERSAARNTGIQASRGTYVMFLDNDDEFLPGKIKAQVHFLDTHPLEYSCCYSRYIRMNSNGDVVMYCAESREGNLHIEALKRNLFVHAGSNLMVRKAVIDQVGGFDTRINANEDIEFLSRILKNNKLGYVNQLGLVVHVDGEDNGNDFDSVLASYLNIITPQLEFLLPDEVNSIYRFLKLQSIRHYVQKGKLINAVSEMKQTKITIILVFRYLVFLLFRKLRKRSYGFVE